MNHRFHTATALLTLILSFAFFLCPAGRLAAQELGNSGIYLEPERVLAFPDVQFSQVLSYNGELFLLYQRVTRNQNGASQSVILRRSSDGSSWTDEETLVSGIPLTTEEIPPIFSMASNGAELAVAVSTDTDEITLYTRTSSGGWQREIINDGGRELLTPRIFGTDSGFMLFASQRPDQGADSLAYPLIVYSSRPTGGRFNGFSKLPVGNQDNVANPYLMEYNGRINIVYEYRQFISGRGFTNQIYLLQSSDLGQSWLGNPRRMTGFLDSSEQGDPDYSPLDYENQNPRLYLGADGAPVMTVDRNLRGRNTRVMLVRLDDGFNITPVRDDQGAEVSGLYYSETNRSSSAAEFFVYQGQEYLGYYYDTTGITRVYLSWLERERLRKIQLNNTATIGYLPHFLIHRGKLDVFWLRKRSDTDLTSSLIYRQPDISANPPRLSALSFTVGRESNREDVSIRVQIPSDPAGIDDLSIAWSMSDNPASLNFESVGLINQLNLKADTSGTWNLYARVRDGAGNVSGIAKISYELDLIPPAPVRFGRLPLDEDGYLLSNSISIPWFKNSEPDLAGYRVRFMYLGNSEMEIDDPLALRAEVLRRISSSSAAVSPDNRLQLYNSDNGLWALAVQAVDRVGNASEPEIEFLRLNKYIPVTYLTLINLRENLIGDQILDFTGRGFTANGVIDHIIFDADGQEPWDYDLSLANGDYRIDSDRHISNISLWGFHSGSYHIILHHSERGYYRHPRLLTIDINGAVKFGDYNIFSPEKVSDLKSRQHAFQVSNLALAVAIPVMLLIILVTLLRIRSIIKDSRILQAEVAALVEGRETADSADVEKRLSQMQKQGLGLRAKFTVFIVILVISVVAVVALPLSNFILSNQRQILAQGLADRITVIMESLGTGARDQFNQSTVLDIADGLTQLSNQTESVHEIEYVTITGRTFQDLQGQYTPPENQTPEEANERYEYIWATTDPILNGTDSQVSSFMDEIDEKFRGENYFQRRLKQYASGGVPDNFILLPGQEIIDDSVSPVLLDKVIPDFQKISEDPEVRQIIEDLIVLANSKIGATSAELQQITNDERIRRSALVSRIASFINIQSIPPFSVSDYNSASRYFTFYYPIYQIKPIQLASRIPQAGEVLDQSEIDAFMADNYQKYYPLQYLGTIRLGISTQTINDQIRITTRNIIIQISIFAAIAIIAGILGALLLASITVNPIKQLVEGVEKIRDTEKKADLKDDPIVVRTKDELHFLSETINQMTAGLIKAEDAQKSVTLGKDVQKQYIALDEIEGQKTKQTTVHQETGELEFFGYYEGAKGVSGDYFYYSKISPDTYAMIKCDVSGKDIEAALIMVSVATLFLDHFNDWGQKQIQQKRIEHALKQKQSGSSLSDLALKINDIISGRGFSGKFAAFNMLTLNEASGEITFCNAGDNIVHIYRRSQRKIVEQQLARTPAAGAFGKDFYEMMGKPLHFPEETGRLEKGDILLLFTDGYEEGRRFLRYDNWEPYQNTDFSKLDPATNEAKAEITAAQRALEEEMKPMALTETDDGIWGEAFSIPRIHNVVNAFMNRQEYHLEKFRNPAADEDLVFDFTNIKTTLPNLILSLMSVEKVFRLVPLPNLGNEDRITIDKKIDDFLRQHFLQYRSYFHHPLPEDEKSLYRRYSHIHEDSQYDDLTILAVEKK